MTSQSVSLKEPLWPKLESSVKKENFFHFPGKCIGKNSLDGTRIFNKRLPRKGRAESFAECRPIFLQTFLTEQHAIQSTGGQE
jgi:hypothetical protein